MKSEKKPDEIPPYRLGVLMNTAAKITRLMVNNPDFVTTYRDCEIILDTVRSAVDQAMGKEEDHYEV